MQIECKLKRAGGSHITLPTPTGGRVAYHFKPINPLVGAAHVAEVADDEHIGTLLGIKEAYRVFHAGKTHKGDMPIAAPTGPTPMDAPGTSQAMPPAVRRVTQAPAASKLRDDGGSSSAPDEIDDKGFNPSAILQGRVSDIVPVLGKLNAAQLREMDALEGVSETPRAGVTKAITRELAARGAD